MIPRSRIVGLVQARMGSTRLPGKALLPLAGEPMLVRVVDRVRAVERLDGVCVVTGSDFSNDPIRELCAARGIDCYSGHDTDVLRRFSDATYALGAPAVLRITADCPLVDPPLLAELVAGYEATACHYAVVVTGASDVPYPRYPDGLDAEVLSNYALAYADKWTPAGPDREHVTRILWREPRPLDTALLRPDYDMGMLRLTVDIEEDYRQVSDIYDRMIGRGFSPTFSVLETDHREEIIAYLYRDGAL